MFRLSEKKAVSLLGTALMILLATGCGTTKWSDTSRTATEQLLISSAMDDVIDEFDFYPLTGRKIYIESKGVSATDKEYLLSLLRQQLSANGVFLQDTKDTADYILEVSTGAVGTNRYDLMYGVPETSVPSFLTLGAATTIPEVSIIKRTDQKAQIKLTMWAYNKTTGAIIWQSGEKLKTASIRDRWVLGAGPITKSSFSDKTEVGGNEVKNPLEDVFGQRIARNEKPSVKTEAIYRELDDTAITQLEDVRKEGLLALSKEEPKPESAGDPNKEEMTAESKPDEAKPEDAASKETDQTADAKPKEENTEKTESKEPALKAEKVDAEPIKTAALPQTAPTLAVDFTAAAAVANTSVSAAGPAITTASVPPVPTAAVPAGNINRNFSAAPAPALDFGNVTLPLGQTYVPGR